MRSRLEMAGRAALRCALLIGVLVGGFARAAETVAAAPAPPASAWASASAPLTVDAVRGVVAELRGDPSFSNTHTERRLRWVSDPASKPPPAAKPPPWLRDLARWLSQGGRGLMWLLGAIAVALLVVYAWRWALVTADAVRERAALRPSHVNDLDIRPESLPDDIAGAARALLARGERRAALSLLYRGALSRLVHAHGVAIRAASTEGECLRLAQSVLAPDPGVCFGQLVRAWQSEVYAGRGVETASLLALCASFDAHFAPALPTASTATAGVPA